MIGFSLVAEGFGFVIPKGYLYAAIGFSVMIEALNQLAIFNRRRFLSANQTLRQRTTEAVMRLLSGQKEDAELMPKPRLCWWIMIISKSLIRRNGG